MTSTPPPVARAAAPDRLASLDGLRGVAALVVVVHHCLFVLPVMARVQDRVAAAPDDPLLVRLLTHTPLHLLWAGEEAVLVFFVLSGLVLTLPAGGRAPVLGGGPRPPPRRLVRLYVPVWAAVAVAVVLYVAVPRRPSAELSPWLVRRAEIPLGHAWGDAVLLDGASLLNTPLWSLQWEVVFSLLLPAFLLLTRVPWRHVPVAGAGLVALVGVGTAAGVDALRYLPVFGFGVLLAAHRDRVARATRRLAAGRSPRWLGWSLGVATAVLLTARWLVAGLPTGDGAAGAVLRAGASGATLAGAVAAVVLALHWPAARAALQRPAVRWLGLRSFSLYLVHEPVVVTLGFLRLPPAATIALSLLASLALAALVFRVVEAPAHRLARRLGQALTPARAVAAPAPAPATGRPSHASTGRAPVLRPLRRAVSRVGRRHART